MSELSFRNKLESLKDLPGIKLPDNVEFIGNNLIKKKNIHLKKMMKIVYIKIAN